MAASSASGEWIEIGTSAEYSALWLSLACREHGRTLTTYEVLPSKAALARETFAVAGVADVVQLVKGDFLDHINQLGEIGFCFLDAEKAVYPVCDEAVVSRLAPSGILVADNAISHQRDLQPMLDIALADRRVDALIVPIGKCELVCRKRSSERPLCGKVRPRYSVRFSSCYAVQKWRCTQSAACQARSLRCSL